MRRAAALLALALLPSSCTCNGSAGGDARAPDALTRDTGRHDTTPDRGVDTRPPFDLFPTGACGGSRTLQPLEIPAGAAESCGPGCQRLTWGAPPDQRYDIKGDLLVYVGMRTSNAVGYRLYYKRISTGQEHRITGDWANKASGCSLATTDGKTIATTCMRSDLDLGYWTRSITRFTPATGLEDDLFCLQRKATDNACFPFFIAQSNAGIVLQYTLGECAEQAPYLLRPGASTLENLASVTRQAQFAQASGHWIVWARAKPEEAGGAYQIVVYDLDTNTQRRIDPTSASQWLPRIDGDQIVWLDHRNDPSGSWGNPKNVDIYHHDLTSGKTTAVTTHPARQGDADVSGKWVAWHDYRKGSSKELDIYAKDLTSGTIYQVSDTPGSEAYPRVDGDRLFYQKLGSDGKLAIFMVDLPTFVAAQKQTP